MEGVVKALDSCYQSVDHSDGSIHVFFTYGCSSGTAHLIGMQNVQNQSPALKGSLVEGDVKNSSLRSTAALRA